MKKMFVAFALIGLVAAGCNKAPAANKEMNNDLSAGSTSDQPQSAASTPTPSVQNKQGANTDQPHYSDGSDMESAPTPEVREIDITSNGFSPATITIHQNDYIVFVNKDSSPHWPASNPHPVHTDLSGFDAKKGLAQGEKYQYQFTKVGTWGFHDHLNPSHTGSVTVVAN